MLKKICFALASAVLLALQAENLLLNPTFAVSSDGFPFDWGADHLQYPGAVTLIRNGGPGGKSNSVKLDLSKYIRYNQTGLRLSEKGKYRISCDVKTENFKYARSGFILYNPPWTWERGIFKLPENTHGKWVHLEAVITPGKSAEKIFIATFYAVKASGSLEVANPCLEPLDDAAKKGSLKALSFEPHNTRISAFYPLLREIPVDRQIVCFHYPFMVQKPIESFQMRISVKTTGDYKTVGVYAIPAKERVVKADLKQKGPCAGRLKAEVIEKATGKIIHSNEYSFRIVPKPPVVKVRERNNLVSDLYEGKLENRTYTFTMPRTGWVWIGFSKPLKNGKAFLDDAARPAIRYRAGEESVTMRQVEIGAHKLVVQGAEPGCTLSIRLVPQLMIYPLNVYPKEDLANFRYDVHFFRKHIWNTFNIHNTGFWNGQHKNNRAVDSELKERGIAIIGSHNLRSPTHPDKLKEAILKNRNMKFNTGVTLDELGSNEAPQVTRAVAEACWELQDCEKQIYTWICGGCCLAHLPSHRSLISGCANVSQGRGKILFETYVTSYPTEKEADEYLEKYTHDIMRCARKCTPDAAGRVMFLMTGLTTNGDWNVDVCPEADIRVYFDKFLNRLANDPVLKGLYGIGCYNIAHCNEENTRWIAKLFHHYGIEGRKDMLSARYGYTYLLPYLKNGDFRQKFQNWNVSAAGKDTLIPRTISKYGTSHQQRQRRDVGDHVAQFTVVAGKPNTLSQKLTALKPGKIYSLTYVTADPEDVEKPKNIHQDPLIQAKISNAQILPEKTTITRYPKGWNGGWGQRKHYREIVTTRILFRPAAKECLLTFTDEGKPALAGKKRIMNFVRVHEYFEDK